MGDIRGDVYGRHTAQYELQGSQLSFLFSLLIVVFVAICLSAGATYMVACFFLLCFIIKMVKLDCHMI